MIRSQTTLTMKADCNFVCCRDTPYDSVHDGYGATLFPPLSVPTTPESSLPSPGDPRTVSACVDSFFTTQSPMYTEATETPVRDLQHARRSRSPPFLPWMQSNPMFEDHFPQVGSYRLDNAILFSFHALMVPCRGSKTCACQHASCWYEGCAVLSNARCLLLGALCCAVQFSVFALCRRKHCRVSFAQLFRVGKQCSCWRVCSVGRSLSSTKSEGSVSTYDIFFSFLSGSPARWPGCDT